MIWVELWVMWLGIDGASITPPLMERSSSATVEDTSKCDSGGVSSYFLYRSRVAVSKLQSLFGIRKLLHKISPNRFEHSPRFSTPAGNPEPWNFNCRSLNSRTNNEETRCWSLKSFYECKQNSRTPPRNKCRESSDFIVLDGIISIDFLPFRKHWFLCVLSFG